MPVGAVVLQTGHQYVTLGTVPEVDSLAIQRIEKIPVAALSYSGSLGVGDSVAFPLDDGQMPLMVAQYPEEEARAYLERFVERNSFQDLRSNAARHNLDTGQNPSTQDIIDAYIDAQVHVGEIDPHREQPVSYSILELAEGIEGDDGPAAPDALGIIENKAEHQRLKLEVTEAYHTIEDEDGGFETVQEVADEFNISWRSVHRYKNDIMEQVSQSDTLELEA